MSIYPNDATPTTRFEQHLSYVLSELQGMLVAKNKSYGNAALDPVRVFSKASSTEQILVRIDDKLSRIQLGEEGAFGEDTIQDLIGYLILLMMARQTQNQERTTTAGAGHD